MACPHSPTASSILHREGPDGHGKWRWKVRYSDLLLPGEVPSAYSSKSFWSGEEEQKVRWEWGRRQFRWEMTTPRARRPEPLSHNLGSNPEYAQRLDSCAELERNPSKSQSNFCN